MEILAAHSVDELPSRTKVDQEDFHVEHLPVGLCYNFFVVVYQTPGKGSGLEHDI